VIGGGAGTLCEPRDGRGPEPATAGPAVARARQLKTQPAESSGFGSLILKRVRNQIVDSRVV
jgi:hypothetical protein